jgi:CRISPR/Cas system-associated protein endoribonuclease Cas2
MRTVRAHIDEEGNVRLLEPVTLTSKRFALVTILEEEFHLPATMLLSEAALAEDWLRPEEDEAWANL